MDVDCDAGHPAFVFECLAPAEDDAANNRVVALKEAEVVGVHKDVVLELGPDEVVLVGDLAEGDVGDERVVAQRKCVPDVPEYDVCLLGRRDWVPKPLPGFGRRAQQRHRKATARAIRHYGSRGRWRERRGACCRRADGRCMRRYQPLGCVGSLGFLGVGHDLRPRSTAGWRQLSTALMCHGSNLPSPKANLWKNRRARQHRACAQAQPHFARRAKVVQFEKDLGKT